VTSRVRGKYMSFRGQLRLSSLVGSRASIAVYPLDLLCQRKPIASDLLIRASYMGVGEIKP
jgi:hypothetical protein